MLAVEGDSAFGFCGMEVETICRYDLPVCIVIFNNDGIYRGTDVNTAGSDPATTVFVKGARYDKMMEAFGGVGVNATSPDELKRAVNAAMDSGKPTLINAVIDPAAGSESGRIGNLNPQSALQKKKGQQPELRNDDQPTMKTQVESQSQAEAVDEEEQARRRRRVKRQDASRRSKAQERRAKSAAAAAVRRSRSARPARRSTACAFSTSRMCSRARPARNCSPGSAPT